MKTNPFTNQESGFSGIVPDGWKQADPGAWLRDFFAADPTHLIQKRLGGLSREEILDLVRSGEALEKPPEAAGRVESPVLTWELYRGLAMQPAIKSVDIALAQAGAWTYLVVLAGMPEEMPALHAAVYLPALQALAPAAQDADYLRQLEAHAGEYQDMIRANRVGLKNGPWPAFPTQTDQERGLPIPPAQKAYDPTAALIDLPAPDSSLLTKPDLYACIADRHSHRKFTDQSLTLAELSYLLWATQGVRKLLADGKISLRTVPASGKRHPFETYLAISRVEGVAPGVYRYLPFEHKLVHLFNAEDLAEKLGELAMDQPFVGEGAACFIWSALPYREEWRYGLEAVKGILLDAGHVCQNLYLACESIGCGTCAIAAYNQDDLDQFLGLDGDQELVVYLAPVGKVESAEK